MVLLATMLERSGKNVAVICIHPGSIEFRGDVSEPVREAMGHVTSVLWQFMGMRNGL